MLDPIYTTTSKGKRDQHVPFPYEHFCQFGGHKILSPF